MAMWLNGDLLQGGSIEASSAGVLLGWGVFTTIGVHDFQPLYLERHIERLSRDAKRVEIPLQWPPEAVERGVREVIRANALRYGMIRLTLTQLGDGRWNPSFGADLSVLAHHAEPRPLHGMRAQVSPFLVDTDARHPLAGVKTTSYLPYFWAWRNVAQNGFDEAILLTSDGVICEGARSTIFWVARGELYTPALKSGCLDGVGRSLVLEWARHNGVAAHEVMDPVEALEEAEEVFFVSGAAGPRLATQLVAGERTWRPQGRYFTEMLRPLWFDELLVPVVTT